jgi:hypothetical protein
MAIKTDDIRQHGSRKHGGPIRFFFQNDLQQDAARQIFTAFGISHQKRLAVHDQVFDFGQRDVAGGIRVVQTAIGVFFNDPFGGLAAG